MIFEEKNEYVDPALSAQSIQSKLKHRASLAGGMVIMSSQ